MKKKMIVPTRALMLLVFSLMSLLHCGVSFRQTPSNRDPDDDDGLGKIDYIRFGKGVRDQYVLSRVLQAVAEFEGIQAMDNNFDSVVDTEENLKRSSDSKPIMTAYLSRLFSKRNADLRANDLTGAGQWMPKRRESKNILDGQVEWLFSRVYPWRVSIKNDDDGDRESYFGNHVDLIGSSIIG